MSIKGFRITLAIAVIFWSGLLSTVFASEADDTCKSAALAGKRLMTMRQSGVSITTLLDALKGNSAGTAMVIDAYSQPKYHGEEMIQLSITEFEAKTSLQCFKNMGQ